MNEELSLLLVGLAYALLPFLGLIAFFQVRTQRARIDRLERLVAELQHGAPAPIATEPRPAGSEPEPSPLADDAAGTEILPDPALPDPALPDPARAAMTAAEPPPRQSLETRLTGRWLIWIGAVALALGGAFLVQASIEAGLLQPPLRILLGLLLAAGLVAVGERLRRRPPAAAAQSPMADHLAPSVSGAGIVIAYAAIYAAHGLYGLIAQMVAFSGLAAVSLVAVGIGLLHGTPVAVLGIAGALAVPAIVGGEADSVAGLFLYLTAVTAVAALVARWRGWTWAILLAYGGSTAWMLAWLLGAPGRGEPWPGALLLIATTLLAMILRRRTEGAAPVDLGGAALTLIAFAGGFALLLDASPLDLTALLAAGLCGALLFDERMGLRPSAGAVVAALLLIVAGASLADRGEALVFAAAGGGLFAAAAFALAHGSAKPGLLVLAGTAGSLLLVAAAYGRTTHGEPDSTWAMVALGMAAIHTGLTVATQRNRDHPAGALLLAASATAALGGIALGATLLLRDAWLSVALAWTVVGAVYVHRAVPVAGVLRAALALATAAAVRLAFNPFVLAYDVADPGGVPWIWPTYGLSILAFLAVRVGLRGIDAPALRAVADAGALSCLVVLVSLQIRLAVAEGPLDRPDYDALEQGLNSAWWLAVGLTLYSRAEAAASPVVRYGWRVLAGLGAAQVVIGHLLVNNPALTGAPVGGMALINLVTLAYAVPALLAAGVARVAARRGERRLALWCGGAALALAWWWVTLTVRHAFHGSRLHEGAGSDGELYAYSVAWLAYGGALLAAGLWRGSFLLRSASLGVVLVAVVKVFLLDMAALTGLWRAVSFIGLGAALLGIGYVYQRYVLRPPPSSPPAPPERTTAD